MLVTGDTHTHAVFALSDGGLARVLAVAVDLPALPTQWLAAGRDLFALGLLLLAAELAAVRVTAVHHVLRQLR